jgi:hypothetical protein
MNHDDRKRMIFSSFANVFEKNWKMMKRKRMNDDDVFYDDAFSEEFDLELISFF